MVERDDLWVYIDWAVWFGLSYDIFSLVSDSIYKVNFLFMDSGKKCVWIFFFFFLQEITEKKRELNFPYFLWNVQINYLHVIPFSPLPHCIDPKKKTTWILQTCSSLHHKQNYLNISLTYSSMWSSRFIFLPIII